MKRGNWKTRKAYKQDACRRRGGPPNVGMRFAVPKQREPGLMYQVASILAGMFARQRKGS